MSKYLYDVALLEYCRMSRNSIAGFMVFLVLLVFVRNFNINFHGGCTSLPFHEQCIRIPPLPYTQHLYKHLLVDFLTAHIVTFIGNLFSILSHNSLFIMC